MTVCQRFWLCCSFSPRPTCQKQMDESNPLLLDSRAIIHLFFRTDGTEQKLWMFSRSRVAAGRCSTATQSPVSCFKFQIRCRSRKESLTELGNRTEHRGLLEKTQVAMCKWQCHLVIIMPLWMNGPHGSVRFPEPIFFPVWISAGSALQTQLLVLVWVNDCTSNKVRQMVSCAF